MMKNLPKKSVALITGIAFAVTSFVAPASYAAPVRLTVPGTAAPSTAPMPKEFGEIVSEYHTQGNQTSVFLIQDAHAIPEAQKNIQKIIRFLADNYGVQTVGVEGASKELDTQIFKSFPDAKRLQEVFDDYMEKGELTGAAAAAIFRQGAESKEQGVKPHAPSTMLHAKFYGLEDQPLYEEGLKLYQEAAGKEADLKTKLEVRSKKLEEEKTKAYSKALLAIDEVLGAFNENHANLTDVLFLLSKIRKPEKGSELRAILDEMKLEKSDRTSSVIQVRRLAKEVECEMTQSAKRIAHSEKNSEKRFALSAMLYADFHAKLQQFNTSQLTPQAFAFYLKEVITENKLPLKVSDHLLGLVRHQKTVQEIQGTKLFKDLETYAAAIKESLFENAGQRDLDRKTHQLQLLTKLTKLELAREEWEEVKRLEVGGWKLEGKSSSLQTPHLSFYRNAEARERAFLTKLDVRSSKLEEKNRRGSLLPSSNFKLQTSIVVAGGFHTQGLAHNLKARGISYQVIMPRIQSLPEQSSYREQMKGNVSWSSYMKAKDGRVNLYEAFTRATRDKLLKLDVRSLKLEEKEGNQPVQLPTSNLQLLKPWRDQILIDLAQTEQLDKAGEYTRFIDEISREHSADLPAEAKRQAGSRGSDSMPYALSSMHQKWQAAVKKFTDGIIRLESQGRYTPDNIVRLLQPATILPETGLGQFNPGQTFPVFREGPMSAEGLTGKPVRGFTGTSARIPAYTRTRTRQPRSEARNNLQLGGPNGTIRWVDMKWGSQQLQLSEAIQSMNDPDISIAQTIKAIKDFYLAIQESGEDGMYDSIDKQDILTGNLPNFLRALGMPKSDSGESLTEAEAQFSFNYLKERFHDLESLNVSFTGLNNPSLKIEIYWWIFVLLLVADHNTASASSADIQALSETEELLALLICAISSDHVRGQISQNPKDLIESRLLDLTRTQPLLGKSISKIMRHWDPWISEGQRIWMEAVHAVGDAQDGQDFELKPDRAVSEASKAKRLFDKLTELTNVLKPSNSEELRHWNEPLTTAVEIASQAETVLFDGARAAFLGAKQPGSDFSWGTDFQFSWLEEMARKGWKQIAFVVDDTYTKDLITFFPSEDQISGDQMVLSLEKYLHLPQEATLRDYLHLPKEHENPRVTRAIQFWQRMRSLVQKQNLKIHLIVYQPFETHEQNEWLEKTPGKKILWDSLLVMRPYKTTGMVSIAQFLTRNQYEQETFNPPLAVSYAAHQAAMDQGWGEYHSVGFKLSKRLENFMLAQPLIKTPRSISLARLDSVDFSIYTGSDDGKLDEMEIGLPEAPEKVPGPNVLEPTTRSEVRGGEGDWRTRGTPIQDFSRQKMEKNAYEELDVPRNASEDEIKRAFRKLAVIHHPDKNPSDRQGAEVKFKRLGVAYELLMDPDQRRVYDQLLDSNSAPRPSSSTFTGYKDRAEVPNRVMSYDDIDRHIDEIPKAHRPSIGFNLERDPQGGAVLNIITEYTKQLWKQETNILDFTAHKNEVFILHPRSAKIADKHEIHWFNGFGYYLVLSEDDLIKSFPVVAKRFGFKKEIKNDPRFMTRVDIFNQLNMDESWSKRGNSKPTLPGIKALVVGNPGKDFLWIYTEISADPVGINNIVGFSREQHNFFVLHHDTPESPEPMISRFDSEGRFEPTVSSETVWPDFPETALEFKLPPVKIKMNAEGPAMRRGEIILRNQDLLQAATAARMKLGPHLPLNPGDLEVDTREREQWFRRKLTGVTAYTIFQNHFFGVKRREGEDITIARISGDNPGAAQLLSRKELLDQYPIVAAEFSLRSEVREKEVAGLRVTRLTGEQPAPATQSLADKRTQAHSLTGTPDSSRSEVRGVSSRSFLKTLAVAASAIAFHPLTASSQMNPENQTISKMRDLFIPGRGIDRTTGYPLDVVIGSEGWKTTQPTSIGFRAEELALSASNRLPVKTGGAATAQAEDLQTLTELLTRLQGDQKSSLAWKGLIPWFKLTSEGAAADRDEIAYVDNANLSGSLMVVIGALLEAKRAKPQPSKAFDAAIEKAQQILDAQKKGYEALFNPARGLFRGGIKKSSGDWIHPNYYIDRLFSEHAGKTAAIISYFGFDEAGYTNLGPAFRTHTFRDQSTGDIAATWDGGVFQFIWNFPFVGDSKLWKTLAENHLKAITDEAHQKNLGGVLSASWDGASYNAGIGHAFRENSNPVIKNNVASLYSLDGYTSISAKTVAAWRSGIVTQVPELMGPYGNFDSMTEGVVNSGVYVAVDHLSSILGSAAEARASAFRTLMKQKANRYEGFLQLIEKPLLHAQTSHPNAFQKLNIDYAPVPQVKKNKRSVSDVQIVDKGKVIKADEKNSKISYADIPNGFGFTYEADAGDFAGTFASLNMQKPAGKKLSWKWEKIKNYPLSPVVTVKLEWGGTTKFQQTLQVDLSNPRAEIELPSDTPSGFTFVLVIDAWDTAKGFHKRRQALGAANFSLRSEVREDEEAMELPDSAGSTKSMGELKHPNILATSRAPDARAELRTHAPKDLKIGKLDLSLSRKFLSNDSTLESFANELLKASVLAPDDQRVHGITSTSLREYDHLISLGFSTNTSKETAVKNATDNQRSKIQRALTLANIWDIAYDSKAQRITLTLDGGELLLFNAPGDKELALLSAKFRHLLSNSQPLTANTAKRAALSSGLNSFLTYLDHGTISPLDEPSEVTADFFIPNQAAKQAILHHMSQTFGSDIVTTGREALDRWLMDEESYQQSLALADAAHTKALAEQTILDKQAAVARAAEEFRQAQETEAKKRLQKIHQTRIRRIKISAAIAGVLAAFVGIVLAVNAFTARYQKAKNETRLTHAEDSKQKEFRKRTMATLVADFRNNFPHPENYGSFIQHLAGKNKLNQAWDLPEINSYALIKDVYDSLSRIEYEPKRNSLTPARRAVDPIFLALMELETQLPTEKAGGISKVIANARLIESEQKNTLLQHLVINSLNLVNQWHQFPETERIKKLKDLLVGYEEYVAVKLSPESAMIALKQLIPPHLFGNTRKIMGAKLIGAIIQETQTWELLTPSLNTALMFNAELMIDFMKVSPPKLDSWTQPNKNLDKKKAITLADAQSMLELTIEERQTNRTTATFIMKEDGISFTDMIEAGYKILAQEDPRISRDIVFISLNGKVFANVAECFAVRMKAGDRALLTYLRSEVRTKKIVGQDISTRVNPLRSATVPAERFQPASKSHQELRRHDPIAKRLTPLKKPQAKAGPNLPPNNRSKASMKQTPGELIQLANDWLGMHLLVSEHGVTSTIHVVLDSTIQRSTASRKEYDNSIGNNVDFNITIRVPTAQITSVTKLIAQIDGALKSKGLDVSTPSPHIPAEGEISWSRNLKSDMKFDFGQNASDEAIGEMTQKINRILRRHPFAGYKNLFAEQTRHEFYDSHFDVEILPAGEPTVDQPRGGYVVYSWWSGMLIQVRGNLLTGPKWKKKLVEEVIKQFRNYVTRYKMRFYAPALKRIILKDPPYQGHYWGDPDSEQWKSYLSSTQAHVKQIEAKLRTLLKPPPAVKRAEVRTQNDLDQMTNYQDVDISQIGTHIRAELRSINLSNAAMSTLRRMLSLTEAELNPQGLTTSKVSAIYVSPDERVAIVLPGMLTRVEGQTDPQLVKIFHLVGAEEVQSHGVPSNIKDVLFQNGGFTVSYWDPTKTPETFQILDQKPWVQKVEDRSEVRSKKATESTLSGGHTKVVKPRFAASAKKNASDFNLPPAQRERNKNLKNDSPQDRSEIRRIISDEVLRVVWAGMTGEPAENVSSKSVGPLTKVSANEAAEMIIALSETYFQNHAAEVTAFRQTDQVLAGSAQRIAAKIASLKQTVVIRQTLTNEQLKASGDPQAAVRQWMKAAGNLAASTDKLLIHVTLPANFRFKNLDYNRLAGWKVVPTGDGGYAVVNSTVDTNAINFNSLIPTLVISDEALDQTQETLISGTDAHGNNLTLKPADFANILTAGAGFIADKLSLRSWIVSKGSISFFEDQNALAHAVDAARLIQRALASRRTAYSA
ncbi:MAG: J domain-containing protein [Candidatus Omnitrophica bacterium]|nr:J domain-containing protein [Candidatus Omnitrophota bacterium]